MYEFYEENKSYCITYAVIMVLCLAGVWLVHDHYRNEPVYSDTDKSVAELEGRIASVEQRISKLQERTANIEKAVSGVTATVSASRENAVIVTDGIGRAEERLDSIIQRQGRIENILADIENANRQRTKNP